MLFLHTIWRINEFNDALFKITQNLHLDNQHKNKSMIDTRNREEESDEETPLQELTHTFTRVQEALEALPFFALIRAHALTKIQGEKKITGKMRGKLLQWLEKLSLNTFKFKRETFITAILILDQHLM